MEEAVVEVKAEEESEEEVVEVKAEEEENEEVSNLFTLCSYIFLPRLTT